MEYHKTINEILKLLDTQIEIVKVGDLLETYKTQFIIKKIILMIFSSDFNTKMILKVTQIVTHLVTHLVDKICN